MFRFFFLFRFSELQFTQRGRGWWRPHSSHGKRKAYETRNCKQQWKTTNAEHQCWLSKLTIVAATPRRREIEQGKCQWICRTYICIWYIYRDLYVLRRKTLFIHSNYDGGHAAYELLYNTTRNNRKCRVYFCKTITTESKRILPTNKNNRTNEERKNTPTTSQNIK